MSIYELPLFTTDPTASVSQEPGIREGESGRSDQGGKKRGGTSKHTYSSQTVSRSHYNSSAHVNATPRIADAWEENVRRKKYRINKWHFTTKVYRHSAQEKEEQDVDIYASSITYPFIGSFVE